MASTSGTARALTGLARLAAAALRACAAAAAGRGALALEGFLTVHGGWLCVTRSRSRRQSLARQLYMMLK